jgi:NAD+-dependent protein deacetylase SIR2
VFLKKLDIAGKLLRLYTQNIDGLEERAGLSSKLPASGGVYARTIELHGNLESQTCLYCSKWDIPFSKDDLDNCSKGIPPFCSGCVEKPATDNSRRYSERSNQFQGRLRPTMILYNERHPRGDHIADIIRYDCRQEPDLLMVMGTSLKIPGVKGMIMNIAAKVHGNGGIVVYIDRKILPQKSCWKNVFDYQLVGELDWIVTVLEKALKNQGAKRMSVNSNKSRNDQQPLDESHGNNQLSNRCEAPTCVPQSGSIISDTSTKPNSAVNLEAVITTIVRNKEFFQRFLR